MCGPVNYSQYRSWHHTTKMLPLNFTSVPYDYIMQKESKWWHLIVDPEWGSSFEIVRVTDGSREVGVFNVTDITSCYSLVRLCLPVATTSSRVILGFSPPHDYHWIHIAEVTFFYRDGSSCTEGSLTPPPVLETAITTSKLEVCNVLEAICICFVS